MRTLRSYGLLTVFVLVFGMAAFSDFAHAATDRACGEGQSYHENDGHCH